MDSHTPTTAADIDTAMMTPRAGPGPPSTSKQDSDAATKEVYASLSSALSNLAGNYDALQGKTMEVALKGTEMDSSEDIKELRQHMKEQDTLHKESMEEIQSHMIDQILQSEGDDMRVEVSQEIVDQIDELVKDQVAHCLKDHMPEDLQLDLAESKREYEDLQLALHNSESRRLNGTLRANKADDVLHTILMSNGSASPRFPKDLRALFDLDADTVKALMDDYGINGISDLRDSNLNKFMQFCGVRYQLVKSDNHKTNSTTHAV
ncbi:hypothetical protein D9756_005509 [Leucocoprinus leucothites]|uniref:Uncharacterized protein n=1 Tax=Leucocoprinus leucothites TaxID=201217 RepID=A0A8H5D728_9AGAR|nr:hypothetical protein D9756_005509 [Leucoagaricus leucothites]